MSGIKNKIIQTYKECHKIIEEGKLQKRYSIHNIYFPNENPWLFCTDEYFYKVKNKTDGLSPWCKKCSIIKARQGAINRNEEIALYQHDYYLTHQEGSYEKRTRHFNKDPEKEKLGTKIWQQTHPEKLKKYNEDRKHKNHKITKKQWIACKDYFKNDQGEWSCAYCELPISKHYIKYAGILRLQDLHKEHVDDNGSNKLDNCIPSCQSCNSSKRRYKFDEWYNPNNKRLKPNI